MSGGHRVMEKRPSRFEYEQWKDHLVRSQKLLASFEMACPEYIRHVFMSHFDVMSRFCCQVNIFHKQFKFAQGT